MLQLSTLITQLKIRAGRASTSMVQDVVVEYCRQYSNQSSCKCIFPDAMTISIQPWDRSALTPIEKAIINSNLGFCAFK